MWKWAKETRRIFCAFIHYSTHTDFKKILSWISQVYKNLLAKKYICIFHDWRYFVIILIFAKYVSFCIKIHRLNNLLNDTNDHFKCRLEYISTLFFVPLLFHSFIFIFIFCPYNFFYSQPLFPNFRVCAWWKVPDKRFKIFHILYVRNPKDDFSVFHFVLLYIFP